MNEGTIKVIVVDDEYMVRGLLRRCIDWKELGMEIVGEASCAQEALELVDRLKPDIIYTDICMPYTDGIELSRLVFEKYPNIKIIVLTGYEEFEYAKRSVKLGIADFLLKPINDDEIRKSALAIKEKIRSERTHSNEYKRLKLLLDENRPYLREKFLNELIQGGLTTCEITEKLAYFELDFDSGLFQAALLETGHPCADFNQSTEEKLILQIQGMESVRMFFRNDPKIAMFFDNNHKIVILNTDPEVDFTQCCETLRIMLANKIKCIVSIGIGNSCKGLENIRQTCREAYYALSYSAILGKNQVICFNAVDLSQKKPVRMQNKQYDEFEFYLKAGLAEKASELFSSFCEGIRPDGGNAIETIWVIASNVISVILSVINESGLKINSIFEDEDEPFKYVFRIRSLPEMREYMDCVICRTANLMEKLKSKKVNKTVDEIKDYINENISSKGLSLAAVAAKFYLNPSYLSRIFKQETGQTFVEYTTKARMELAVRLLSQTEMKAYEVAERVGIQDPHYFSICFKKYTGISINDYRKSCSNS